MSGKVLVIGSNSFSGAGFSAYLLRQGCEVLGVSRSEPPHRTLLPYLWEPNASAFRFQHIDLNHDLLALDALVKAEKPKLIVNFAAQSMVAQSWQYPEHWMMTNAVSAVKLFELLRGYDFLDRYVHVTTPEVYGSTDGFITEEARFNPSTPYAVSRAAGDMALKAWAQAYGLPVSYTRAANVYGPGQQLYRIVPRTILFMLLGRKLQLHGGGLSQRSFIHMDDVSAATWAIARQAPVGEAYHISTNEIVTIRGLVQRVAEKLGFDFDTHVDVAPERLGKDAAYLLDSTKLRSALGWRETVSLDAGLDACIAWVKRDFDALKQLPMDYTHKP
jgi:dTDP-glucose 4,6-dehydratase